MKGSKPVDHWTCGTVHECSEVAGSPHRSNFGEEVLNEFEFSEVGIGIFRNL
jgi:hypothetical protein